MWSIERVGCVFGLETIGKKDWYAWGAPILLALQDASGRWDGEFELADTCFALLFLRRSNLVSDLTAVVKNKAIDPVEAVLKGGGVGGEALLKGKGASLIGRGMRPAIDLSEKGGGPKEGAPAKEKKDAAAPAGKGTEGAAKAPKKEEPKKKPEETPRPQPKDTGTAKRPEDPAKTAKKAEETAKAQPKEAAGGESARLRDQLVKAAPQERRAVLQKLRAGKGSDYTLALAAAVPKLSGTDQAKARQALVDRLSDMTAKTLRGWLKYDDAEVRRAAVLACAVKDDKSLVPDLIRLLESDDADAARAARRALKSLTGQDLGAVARPWQVWWEKQAKK
jgi:hypothetical protein